VALDIYKRGQGKLVRMGTLGGGSLIGALIAHYVSGQLINYSKYIMYGIPVIIFLGIAGLMYWLVNRSSTADFMIATEGEMKKVSWSTKREIIGGTKVVIVTTLTLAVLLWAVDLAFAFFFNYIGVLQIASQR
jgi:preprotein translocase subunit SecE